MYVGTCVCTFVPVYVLRKYVYVLLWMYVFCVEMTKILICRYMYIPSCPCMVKTGRHRGSLRTSQAIQAQRNNKARFCNYLYRRKAKCVKHYECVSVFLPELSGMQIAHTAFYFHIWPL
jgi:hypothetical protein